MDWTFESQSLIFVESTPFDVIKVFAAKADPFLPVSVHFNTSLWFWTQ